LLLWFNIAPAPSARTLERLSLGGADLDQDFRFHYGYIDHSLQFVIGPQVEEPNFPAQEFSEGVVWIFRGYKNHFSSFGLVDTNGHQFFTVNGAWAASPFCNGISTVNQSWYINKFGQVSGPTPYISIEYPSQISQSSPN